MESFTNNKADQDSLEVAYDVSESFPLLMGTCVKMMRETLNKVFLENGYTVTSEQWVILSYLAERDGVSQQDLAIRSDRSEVAVLNLLKKLELAELVSRRRDPGDARSNLVYLTTKGCTLHQSLVPLATANVVRMSAGVTAQEVDQLKNILRKVRKNLKG